MPVKRLNIDIDTTHFTVEPVEHCAVVWHQPKGYCGLVAEEGSEASPLVKVTKRDSLVNCPWCLKKMKARQGGKA